MDKIHTTKSTPKKVETVKELTEKISRAKAMMFTDYRGLKHKQLEDLRRLLKKVEGEFVVTKNRLLKRALDKKAEPVASVLEDTTATLFSYKDEVSPLRELLKFFKAAGTGKTKGGFLGDRALSPEEVTRLAQLPTRDILLGLLVRQLNAPVQGLHYALSWNINKFVWALDAVKNKKGD